MYSVSRMSFFVILSAAFCLVAGCSDYDCQCPVLEPEGEWVRHDIPSNMYLGNRFFRLTGDAEENRIPQTAIDPSSVQVFRLMADGPVTGNQIRNVAVYADRTGRWEDNDFTADPAYLGERWAPVYLPRESGLLVDRDQSLWGVDIGADQGDGAILAVTFDYWTTDGPQRVGDSPGYPPSRTVYQNGVLLEGDWYHLKLLKAPSNEDDVFAHALMIRQIYSLGMANIDPGNFRFRLESFDLLTGHPERDENGVPYLQIFGLDKGDNYGLGERDEKPDLFRDTLFNLNRGLLIFPESFSQPFAADQTAYENNAAGTAFVWSDSAFLYQNLVPKLYSLNPTPTQIAQSGRFRFVVEQFRPFDD